MRVQMVTFPETKVAAITHIGPRSRDHDTVRKLVRWKLEHRLLDPARYRSYGLHYTDPRTVNPGEHRVEFCLSIETAVVAANADGIHAKTLVSARCALASDIGNATIFP
tara:strand:+ start:843 stop:1169 length:327 start_codon:yes stop_codon:yes gene_type:complete